MSKTVRGSFEMETGYREDATPAEMSVLVGEIVQLIVSRCGPADAALASMSVVKIVGELVRGSCNDDVVAQQILTEATERVRRMRVACVLDGEEAVVTTGDDDDDPFTIPN